MLSMLKWALWIQFRKEWIFSAMFSLIGESCGVIQCYYISVLIKFIQDKDKSLREGLIMLLIYTLLTLT